VTRGLALQVHRAAEGVMGNQQSALPPPPPPSVFESLLDTMHQPIEVTPASIIGTVIVGLAGVLLIRSIAPMVWGEASDEDERVVLEAESRRRAYREELVMLTFRAFKAVAMCDGVLHDKERALLMDCQSALTVQCPDFDALEPLEPEDLQRSVIASEPEKQAYMLMLMMHIALVDGQYDAKEVALVKRFADALGVEAAHLESLKQRVLQHHQAAKTRVEASQPGMRRSSSAILLNNTDFFEVLSILCHR
jgi:tellurite resistance protein